jgi:DNA modification methylase
MTIQFLQGDCLTVMKELPDKSVDLFLCDLPWGCLWKNMKPESVKERENNNITGKAYNGCAWDIKIDLTELWTQIHRLSKNDNTPALFFTNTRFGYDLIRSNEKGFRYDLVWNKLRPVSFLDSNRKPLRSHEMIYVFSKNGAYYNRVDVEGGKGPEIRIRSEKEKTIPNNHTGAHIVDYVRVDSKRCVKSVIDIMKRDTRNGHPTEKPIALYRMLIERYCPPGGTVLDPTAGSFNSCYAAEIEGRNAIGIEKDPVFYKKAVDTYNEAILEPVQNEIILTPLSANQMSDM